ncbi:shikimate dehydrogenase [Thalassotalea ganghwensis]
MEQYRVYGNPIKQSKSPFIHRLFAQQTKQAIEYQKELVAFNAFESTVRSFIEQGGKGANVTVPFKEQAFDICDQLTDRAKLSEAVNTLSFSDGKIFGDNTDGIGLVNDLYRCGVKVSGKNILLLGAGGAAKGVIPSLLAEQPAQLVIANRTQEKALAIAHKYNIETVKAMTFEELVNYQADIIINATSSGLSGHPLSIPPTIFTKTCVCYDMVYGKDLPIFLQQAQTHGVDKLIDGLGMLVFQAAAAFEQWRGVRPDPDAVMTMLRQELHQ